MITTTPLLKPLLLILTTLGVLIPYSAFIPLISMHGLHIPLFVEHIMTNRLAAFAWLDVIISAIVLLLVAYTTRMITIKQAVIVTLFTCGAGVSAGLPLFFYFFISRSQTDEHS